MNRAIRLLRLHCAALSLSLGAGAAVSQPARDWSVRIPSDETVVYRGIVDLDAAGMAMGPILYPGGAGLGGLLVGILAHSAIVESGKNAQKQKMQDEADQALHPFRDQLAGFRYPELLQVALRRMTSNGRKVTLPSDGGTGEWIIATQPVFGMTRDRRALVMDNAIALLRAGETQPVYSVTVRVVSAPRGQDDPVAEWAAPAEAGTALKEESAHLIAHSLEVALRDSERTAAGSASGFRTLRYAQGGSEKMERAQELEAFCQRVVVRNLRGWLMSLPQPEVTEGPAAGCAGTAWR